jgi:tRNA dimethylallyltransferase
MSPGHGAPPAPGHVAVVGATASGKSAVAMALARQEPGWELVTVDSMQVYRGMDVGTAKPTRAEQAEVPHHLLDLVEPSDEFGVADYQLACRRALADIEGRGHRALLVGGTGLYLRAITDDLDIPGRYPEARAAIEADDTVPTEALHARLVALDPLAAGRMEPTNRRRVLRALEVTIGSGRPFSSFGPGLEAYPPTPITMVGLAVGRDELDGRIAERLAAQLDDGLLDEVRALASRPDGLSRTAAQALAYRELLDHLAGQGTLDDAVALALVRTRQFARRQERWFRRDPRLVWIEAGHGHNPLVGLRDLVRG